MEPNPKISTEIKTLNNLLRRFVEGSMQEKGLDEPSMQHHTIMYYLFRNQDKEIFQKDIEKELSIRRSTVSHLLVLMEKKGLIIREDVKFDARLKKLSLTPKSIELCMEGERLYEVMEVQLTKGLTDEEISAFLSAISKMKNNIQ